MRGAEMAANLVFWSAMPASAWWLVRRLGWGLLAAGSAGVAIGVALALAVSWLISSRN